MIDVDLIDLKAGNIYSVENALRCSGANVNVVTSPTQLRSNKIILPGVGAYDDYVNKLKTSAFFNYLTHLNSDKFLLGICIGMQVLGSSSQEGNFNGLNLIPGRVEKINCKLPLPHLGWNEIDIKTFPVGKKIFTNIDTKKGFYYLHNYKFISDNPSHTLAVSNHSTIISSVINKDKIYGAQFHPEKSHQNGVLFFRNFLEL